MDKKRLYRVSFYNNGKVFEVYVRNVSSSNLFGFVELEEIVFGKKSSILVDPTEEGLRSEFESTKRFFVPLHSVIRIDEMQRETNPRPRVVTMKGGSSKNSGQPKGAPSDSGGGSHFPPHYVPSGPFTKK